MDDLISRSELIQEIKRQFRCAECDNYGGIRCRACPGDDMINLAEDSCAVDAVQVVRCKDCIYFKERHVLTPDGQEKSYAEMPQEAFGSLGNVGVTSGYGINVCSQCIVDCGRGYGEDKTVFREPGDFCSRGVRKEDAHAAD